MHRISMLDDKKMKNGCVNVMATKFIITNAMWCNNLHYLPLTILTSTSQKTSRLAATNEDKN